MAKIKKNTYLYFFTTSYASGKKKIVFFRKEKFFLLLLWGRKKNCFLLRLLRKEWKIVFFIIRKGMENRFFLLLGLLGERNGKLFLFLLTRLETLFIWIFF